MQGGSTANGDVFGAQKRMVTLLKRSKMNVPNWSFFRTAIVLFLFAATVLAVTTLLYSPAQENWGMQAVSVVGACIWLLIVSYGVFGYCRDWGGLREASLDLLEVFAWLQFVECLADASDKVVVRFGFSIFGFRFLRLRVAVNKISRVEVGVAQGQGFGIVLVSYDHDELEPTHRRRRARHRGTGAGLYTVGPSMGWERVVRLGRSLVKFLRDAGAKLSRAEDGYTWVRAALETVEGMEEQT